MCGIHKQAESAHTRGNAFMIGVYEESVAALGGTGVSSQHARIEEKHESDWLATIPGSDDPHYMYLYNVENNG